MRQSLADHERSLAGRAKFMSAQIWSLGWKGIIVYAIYTLGGAASLVGQCDDFGAFTHDDVKYTCSKATVKVEAGAGGVTP